MHTHSRADAIARSLRSSPLWQLAKGHAGALRASGRMWRNPMWRNWMWRNLEPLVIERVLRPKRTQLCLERLKLGESILILREVSLDLAMRGWRAFVVLSRSRTTTARGFGNYVQIEAPLNAHRHRRAPHLVRRNCA